MTLFLAEFRKGSTEYRREGFGEALEPIVMPMTRRSLVLHVEVFGDEDGLSDGGRSDGGRRDGGRRDGKGCRREGDLPYR